MPARADSDRRGRPAREPTITTGRIHVRCQEEPQVFSLKQTYIPYQKLADLELFSRTHRELSPVPPRYRRWRPEPVAFHHDSDHHFIRVRIRPAAAAARKLALPGPWLFG